MAITTSQNKFMNRYLAKVKFKHNSLPTTNHNGQGVIKFFISSQQNFVAYDTIVMILVTPKSHCAKERCLKQKIHLKNSSKKVHQLFLVFIVCCDVATHGRDKDFKR